MTAELIGREHPAAVIGAEITRTLDSHGGLVLVTGESGMGKTALVTRILADAGAKGAVVASGACWDGQGAPGYWPWVQVARSLQRELGADWWREVTEAAGPGLTYLLGDFTEPPTLDSLGDADFQLCDAVTTALVTIARKRPLIVALDDLHWADTPSLRMLAFVVRHTWLDRILVVGTYRDVEIESPGHPVRELLRPLESKATTVMLSGLDLASVRTLIGRTAGRQPSAEFAADIHRRTGGNPLFVEQLARLWQAGGPMDVPPPGVRDAVERRLSHLPLALRDMLAHAAVIGTEFHRQVLAPVAGRPMAEIHQLLQQAALSRLVVPHEGGRFRFAHDLVREILYNGLDLDERRHRHAQISRILAERSSHDGEPSQVAHHAYLAVPDVPPADAATYLLAAGREAACRLAIEEAALHYRRVLSLNDQLSGTDLVARADGALAELEKRTGDAVQAGAPGDDNVFRPDGDVWTLSYAGKTVHMPDAKGLRDLHALLRRPGTDVPAVELLTAGGDDESRAARSLGGDDVLDDTAKERFHRRLDQLDEELERTLARQDDERAAELDRERAALLDELRRAAGLGGRTRRLGDEAERSRKTVTARIRDTLRRLDRQHPELASHLRDSVSTGTVCRYRPRTAMRWEL